MSPIDLLLESERSERYERLARKALAAYRLQDAELRLLGWRDNVVFRVQTDDGRWALRICRPGRDHKALLRELLWLVALNRDTPTDAPEPVIMRSGELMRGVSIPGLSGFHPCMLFRWVKGQVEDDLTAAHLRSVGRLTAVLHKHAQKFRWPEELSTDAAASDRFATDLPRETLRKSLSTDDIETLHETIPAILQTLQSLGYGHDVAGVIHGALERGNILFHGGEARAIDFECVHRNHYALDIATTFADLPTGIDSETLKSAYAEGYTQIRPLPCDLHEHLPAFHMLRAHAAIIGILRTPHTEPRENAAEIARSAVGTARQWMEST